MKCLIFEPGDMVRSVENWRKKHCLYETTQAGSPSNGYIYPGDVALVVEVRRFYAKVIVNGTTGWIPDEYLKCVRKV